MRNKADLDSLACPRNYRQLRDFPSYYEGTQQAPFLTLFIGGNHEASGFLLPLWFGGWVAPNIYYLGRSGVVTIDGFRLAGVSGIYKRHDYQRGYYERMPLNESTMRSVYHVREIELKKLAMVGGPLRLVMSHDWPTEAVQSPYDQARLLRKKPYFKDDLEAKELGNPHLTSLLRRLKPAFWMSAHLHVNFQCQFCHSDDTTTTFVSHDKPKRQVSTSFLEPESNQLRFCVRPSNEAGADNAPPKRARSPAAQIHIDLEWLAITRVSWRDVSISQSAKTVDTEDYQYSWRLVNELVANVESQGLASWNDSIKAEQGDAPDNSLVPNSAGLWKYTFPLPDWTVLDYRDPNKQTLWWYRLLGIPDGLIQGPMRVWETTSDYEDNESTSKSILPKQLQNNPLLDDDNEDNPQSNVCPPDMPLVVSPNAVSSGEILDGSRVPPTHHEQDTNAEEEDIVIF
eukprot:Protomagalhaensia_sp_Gyna_25__839@NODE_1403_length_1867_cov_60_458425_g1131_i0_p1_GENE_NODE_1403_length_1867_cov_60_458425_g1131_i0NODE_1403_length_1867_cov_60_458425_g1131_i0_p1_ORF_typecomplete_len456_score46_83DBR1/PF05011_13/0_00071Metallophos/PF00149_28/0_063CytoC_RC/PF02276_18/0_069_NODE_1403_length_1867_cov_60_458425_g1131_i0581425